MRNSDDIDDRSCQEQDCQCMGLGPQVGHKASQEQESQKHPRAVGKKP